MSDQQDLKATWAQVKEKLLDEMGDFNRSLWDAANAAELIALDEDQFVLGVPPGKMSLGSHLDSTANAPLVRRCVEAVVGRSVNVEIVEGTDPDAWEREKHRREQREQAAIRRQQVSRETAGARAIWAELYEEIGRLFGGVRERRFALVRAKAFAKALLAMVDTEQKALEEDPEAEELHQQQLDRSIERIASLAEIPATMVAVEYLRVKSIKRG